MQTSNKLLYITSVTISVLLIGVIFIGSPLNINRKLEREAEESTSAAYEMSQNGILEIFYANVFPKALGTPNKKASFVINFPKSKEFSKVIKFINANFGSEQKILTNAEIIDGINGTLIENSKNKYFIPKDGQAYLYKVSNKGGGKSFSKIVGLFRSHDDFISSLPEIQNGDLNSQILTSQVDGESIKVSSSPLACKLFSEITLSLVKLSKTRSLASNKILGSLIIILPTSLQKSSDYQAAATQQSSPTPQELLVPSTSINAKHSGSELPITTQIIVTKTTTQTTIPPTTLTPSTKLVFIEAKTPKSSPSSSDSSSPSPSSSPVDVVSSCCICQYGSARASKVDNELHRQDCINLLNSKPHCKKKIVKPYDEPPSTENLDSGVCECKTAGFDKAAEYFRVRHSNSSNVSEPFEVARHLLKELKCSDLKIEDYGCSVFANVEDALKHSKALEHYVKDCCVENVAVSITAAQSLNDIKMCSPTESFEVCLKEGSTTSNSTFSKCKPKSGNDGSGCTVSAYPENNIDLFCSKPGDNSVYKQDCVLKPGCTVNSRAGSCNKNGYFTEATKATSCDKSS